MSRKSKCETCENEKTNIQRMPCCECIYELASIDDRKGRKDLWNLRSS